MMVTRSHEHLEELIAADALGGLDESERQLLAQEIHGHGPACPVCARLIADYSEVAGRLALSLDPAPFSAGAEDRLILAAMGGRSSSEPDTDHDEPKRRIVPIGPGRARRWIAAVVAAAVIGGVGGFFVARSSPQGIRVVALAGAPDQQVAVAFQPGRTEGWVIASGLPEPGAGKVYELWFRRTGSTKMEAAGTFLPTDGSAIEPTHLAEDVDLLAVTIEPAPGTNAPTSDPIFAAPVPPT